MLKKISFLDIIFLFLISILCYLVFFQNLGEYSARMWDESRNAVNALEMLQNGNLIVTYYNGIPDVWNTKPPLLIWLIGLSFKIFGVSEFALRLPSALAASLVAICMYLFSAKWLKNKWIGIFSTLILFSSFGFSDIHIGRSGDYDALLTLFVFLGCIHIFIYLETWKKKYMYISVLFWTLAVLTKGVAGILMFPAILIYLIISKKVILLVSNKSFWISAGSFIAVVLAYYLGRELLNPGYLSAVWHEELFGRSTIRNAHTEGMFEYYWKFLSEFRFQHWIYFVPFSIAPWFFIKNKLIKNWILFAYLLVVIFYLIISISQGKNLWYDAQLYPFASLLVAILIISLIQKLPAVFWIIPILIVSFYTQRYVRTNLAYIQRPDLEQSVPCLKYGYFFRENKVNKSNLFAVHNNPEFCMPFTFYTHKEQIPTKPITAIQTNDKILSCDDEVLHFMKDNFEMDEIKKASNGCEVWEIKKLNL